MKTNLRRLGSMVMAVGMMSALSLTAFAAEAIPATKITMAATSISASDSIPMTKIVNIADKDSISVMDGEKMLTISKAAMIENFEAVSGFTVKTLPDGTYEVVDKKTGKKVTAIKAVETIPATQSTASAIKK